MNQTDKISLLGKLAFISLLIAGMIFFSSSNSFAQDAGIASKGIGLSISLSSTPEEADFSSSGAANEVYFDWSVFRLGYNTIQAEMSFNKYGTTWLSTLETSSFYAAYRISSETSDSIMDFYSLFGLSYTMTSLTVAPGAANETADSFGFIAGAGFLIYIGNFAFGPQYTYFSSKDNFGGIDIATGSNQTQLTLKASF